MDDLFTNKMLLNKKKWNIQLEIEPTHFLKLVYKRLLSAIFVTAYMCTQYVQPLCTSCKRMYDAIEHAACGACHK